MDDIVRQAIAKWPNVPACYGWLGLDDRGGWYLRDDATQAQGAFQGDGKGDLLQHEKLIAFIGRNYAADDRGCWYFQNGPQRVYVELSSAPWIWRVAPDLSLKSHTGVSAQYQACEVDELGRVYLVTDLGFGLVHSLDVDLVANALEQGVWAMQEVRADALGARHGFVTSPQQLTRDAAAAR